MLWTRVTQLNQILSSLYFLIFFFFLSGYCLIFIFHFAGYTYIMMNTIQENVLAESRMMVPDCSKRLEAALSDLKATVVCHDAFKYFVICANDFLFWCSGADNVANIILGINCAVFKIMITCEEMGLDILF